jgi:hypothetical protein
MNADMAEESTANTESLLSIFNKKYNEFVAELRSVFPELDGYIESAFNLTEHERIVQFREHVLPVAGNPRRDTSVCPGMILPGVVLTAELWNDISDKTRSAIQEYLTLLSFCLLLNDGGSTMEDALPANFNLDAMGNFMNMFKGSLGGIDFTKISDKLGKLFEGIASGVDASGNATDESAFKLPERFMNGHIARFAREILRDIKPEDFGIDESIIGDLEKNPAGAIEMVMNLFKSNPDFLQNSLKRVGKRIQAKVISGEIRPQEIAREAEELMKEFINNPAFAELMESFRGMFGFEDMDFAKAAGKEGSARLALVKDRLRKKMDAKKSAKTGTTMTAGAVARSDAIAAALLAEETAKAAKQNKQGTVQKKK